MFGSGLLLNNPFGGLTATAAATAAAEEFPNFSSLHPITHRGKISRSGTPLTPIIDRATENRKLVFFYIVLAQGPT